MKGKKGKSRKWRMKRKTAKLGGDGAGEMMKKKMDGTKTTTTGGDWSSSGVAELPLPLDVWGDIFSRLSFKQVLVCRCICRAWNALLARVYHPHHNPTTPATILSYPPWLWRPDSRIPLRSYLTLVEHRNGASYPSTVTRIEDSYTCRTGADYEGDDKFLCPVASCHGLVCFVRKIDERHRKNIFVGNPLLKERLLLVRPSKMINMKTKAYQWSDVVGFGFSPRADRYKIVRWLFNREEDDQSHFLICTVGDGRCRGKRKSCPPRWRGLLSSHCHFGWHPCQLGSHLNAGIHWLVSDSDKDNSVFISRLDLDTEQFGRVEAPQSPDFNGTPLGDLSLGVSDGRLIICANLRDQDIIDIWVMNQLNLWSNNPVVLNQLNLWSKNLVVRSPITPDWRQRVEVLNYGQVEAAAKEGAVAEVMLLVVHLFAGSCRLYACTTRGRHVRELDFPLSDETAIVHIPSLLSIKDAAKL